MVAYFFMTSYVWFFDLQTECKSNLDKEPTEDQMIRVEVEENIKITLIDPPCSKNGSGKETKEDRQHLKYSPLLRRTHVKALSVGDTGEEDDFPKSFNQNRELWQQRASSHTSVNSVGLQPVKEVRDFRQKHTPDLVMDLPVQEPVKSPEEGEAHSEPESPDMALAAERFAKQNQCTLKKNTRELHRRNDKTESKSSNGAKSNDEDMSPRMSPIKPQIKAKPQILRKPALNPSLPVHLMRKDRMEQE